MRRLIYAAVSTLLSDRWLGVLARVFGFILSKKKALVSKQGSGTV